MGLFDRLRSKLPPAASAPAPVPPPPAPATATPAALAEQARRDGNAALQAGRADLALQHYERFAELRPEHAPAHVNRGFALLTLGRLPEAESAFRQALQLAPADFECRHCLAQCLEEQGRVDEALAEYERNVQAQPDFAMGWLALGLLQERSGATAAALSSLRRAAAAQADLAPAWQGIARLSLALADGAAALEAADRWAALEPGAAYALGMRADALRLLKLGPEALQAAQAALALAPDDPRLQLAEGAALLALQQHARAKAVLEHVLAKDPANVEALTALATAFEGADRNDQAMRVLDRIQALDPGQAEALHLRALALMNQCRHDEAAVFLQQRLRERPDDARLQFDLAVAWLTLGHWADGWQQYEWRWAEGSSPSAVAQMTGGTRWQPGGEVVGRTVLLQSEQGLGDAIQFIRYVPAVLARGAQVVLQLSPRLHALLPAPWPGCRIVGQVPPPQEFDLQCPLLSLPRVLGMREPLRMDAPYVSAAEHRRAHWRARLDQAAVARVGLVWAGNPDHPDDRRRSLPLDTMRQALQGLAGVQFVSLQIDIRDRDRSALAAWPELLHFGPEQTDMADTAALVEELDAVVCVDTSLAHLTGALGRPLWLLLPFKPDWRWGLTREDTPWYPSARLLRQPQPGDWAAVLARLRGELPGALQSARRA